MVNVVARMQIKDGCMDKFLEALMSNVPTVKAEAGCLRYDVCRDLDPAKSQFVTILESWESEEALRIHQKAPHMDTYRAAVRDLREHTTVDVMEPIDR
ncbi:MAG: antibiotic biosynthesis monooxygenase [Victivallaceae bacterium]|nr:antibiotic biosynthesis monooxygenase [Victivallaceae bacterium]